MTYGKRQDTRERREKKALSCLGTNHERILVRMIRERDEKIESLWREMLRLREVLCDQVWKFDQNKSLTEMRKKLHRELPALAKRDA